MPPAAPGLPRVLDSGPPFGGPSLGVPLGSPGRFLSPYAQVTAAQARLTPSNAVTEIDRLILTAWRDKLPVYLELPSDIACLDIEAPAAPLALAEPHGDPERLRSCTAAIADRLAAATSPAILADLDADRFGAAAEIMRLAEKTQAPVAVAATAKAVIDETFPYYAGIYNGKATASEPDLVLVGIRRSVRRFRGQAVCRHRVAPPITRRAFGRRGFQAAARSGPR
jgi:thiamine pyrophosphate-dependent acetolactate synthase large subunit-like protein